MKVTPGVLYQLMMIHRATLLIRQPRFIKRLFSGWPGHLSRLPQLTARVCSVKIRPDQNSARWLVTGLVALLRMMQGCTGISYFVRGENVTLFHSTGMLGTIGPKLPVASDNSTQSY
eukprot:scaffold238151_cov17-Prasinocladus_malaysianus.AAC.1